MLSAIKGQPLRSPGYQLLTGTTIQLVTAALTEARCFEAKLPEMQQELTMKKTLILLAVALAMAAGTVALSQRDDQLPPIDSFALDQQYS
jgi:hypothetical protein